MWPGGHQGHRSNRGKGGFAGGITQVLIIARFGYLKLGAIHAEDFQATGRGPVEDPSRMTSTGSLSVIVPKMLFHVCFQHQRHRVNIKHPVTFLKIVATSKQHVAPGYW